MTARSTPAPKYRRQKKKTGDLAFVELSGKRFYLGPYGTEESREKYHRLLAEWTANNRQLVVPPQEITIVELTAHYWEFAQRYYRKADGSVSPEVHDMDRVLKLLKEHYGYTKVAGFGPRALKALRQKLIDRRLTRYYINKTVERIRRIFRWGVEEELVPPSVYHGLQAVAGLRRGRSEAREMAPVKPVPAIHIDALKPHVSRQVWALIQLQLYTAARPGELLVMRACDIDTEGKVWTYTPESHKTAHHGYTRTIYLGPNAQRVIGNAIVPPRLQDLPIQTRRPKDLTDDALVELVPVSDDERDELTKNSFRSVPQECSRATITSPTG